MSIADAPVTVRRRRAAPESRAWPLRALMALRSFAIGSLLCLTPLTSILVLGWFSRHMATLFAARTGKPAPAPGWIMGPSGEGWATRLLGGLGSNLAAGFGTLAACLVLTLPFTALWLGSWWAGWENSFNKGYEQAWVGPSVFLIGTAFGAVLMALLPLALTHAAVEGRWSAALQFRRLHSAFAQAGWRMAGLSGLTVLFALPLFAARGLPAFAGAMIEGIETLPPEDIARLIGAKGLATAAYVFVSLLILRRMAARIYARAAPRAAWAEPVLWAGTRARAVATQGARRPRLVRAFWLVLSAAILALLAFLILAGQFLNYGWWHWLTHPFLVLPWQA